MMVRRGGDAAPGFGMRRMKQFRYFLISRSGLPPSVRLLLGSSFHYCIAFDLYSIHAHHCVIIRMDTALLVLVLTWYLQFIARYNFQFCHALLYSSLLDGQTVQRTTAVLLGVYETAGVGEGERRLRDTAAHVLTYALSQHFASDMYGKNL
ncbi:hypothetical protein BDN71DRAFT_88473 [Pleurotus eryngii]|uniref:Uncharacterized protein n=1 Tax=Pleurotus eryngii TaxID=5323 RepID=A0A9P5ZNU7_PLEER|nr:hypothetical protein BDN71DRAFT_88473 [Pleurotus eryngii]